MAINEYNLALELGKPRIISDFKEPGRNFSPSVFFVANEIIEDRKLCGRAKTIHHVLVSLRKIGIEGLSQAWESKDNGSRFHILKRVLRAFHKMSRSDFSSCRVSINVPDELLTLLEEWERKFLSKDDFADFLILIDFIIKESAPIDVLSMLVRWSKSNDLGPALFSRLDSLLRRGVQLALKTELSGSLLRMKYMRRDYAEENRPLMLSEVKKYNGKEENGIWKRMSLGTLSINK